MVAEDRKGHVDAHAGVAAVDRAVLDEHGQDDGPARRLERPREGAVRPGTGRQAEVDVERDRRHVALDERFYDPRVDFARPRPDADPVEALFVDRKVDDLPARRVLGERHPPLRDQVVDPLQVTVPVQADNEHRRHGDDEQ
jgi:hypothetical protein